MMEPALNCSADCPGPRSCFLQPGVDHQEAWRVLRRLCSLALVGHGPPRTQSLVLRVIVGVMLSGGILLALFFLAFTLRCRNNRIVKMSSPNLNVLTLCGSVLTYCSGFLYTTEESSLLPLSSPATLLQVRIWTLCIGSSLVFGPILAKTWRLYRIFTQRMPNRRVIIKDIQLIGLVALLIVVDVLVLSTWGLTDPVQCARSIAALVKCPLCGCVEGAGDFPLLETLFQVAEGDVSYSLSQTESCSSLYTDVWIFLLSVLKGGLLLYGTYLAGLTSNVSSPPVNQSPTIMATVCLVCLSAAGVVLVSGLLPAWPSVVHGFVSGAIFLCTLTINCVLFVPQLRQWKQFEGEQKPSANHMAKFFSSPSKGLYSMYSEEGLYHLLEENVSMKRLLTEKDAVIVSLQEQVNSAKDKLLRLMSASTHPGAFELPYRLSLSSTHSAELANSSSPLLSSITGALPSPLSTVTVNAVAQGSSNSSLKSGISTERRATFVYNNIATKDDSEHVDCISALSLQPNSCASSTFIQTSVSSQQTEVVSPSPRSEQAFISSEQLQEVLQELSQDAFSALHTESSFSTPVISHYRGISPYVMRKRRPPFRACMQGASTGYSLGSQHMSQPLAASAVHLGPSASERKAKPSSFRCQPHDVNPMEKRKREREGDEEEATPDQRSQGLKENHCGESGRRFFPPELPGSHPVPRPSKTEGPLQAPWDDSDSESSSSEEDCCYRRPYCRACMLGSFESIETSASETDSESAVVSVCGYRIHSLVSFKEDLRPTFV